MLAKPECTVVRGALCGSLFGQGLLNRLTCPRAKVQADFHGGIVANHVVEQGWDLQVP